VPKVAKETKGIKASKET
jgi:hypothetical protein